MSPKDLDIVMEIEELSFPDCWVEGMFLAEMDGPISNAVVAEEDERVVGYSVYRVILDECHLMNLAFHPEMRREGRGRRLLKWVIADCMTQAVEYMFLEVRPSNRAGLQLYAKFGFKVIDVRKKYYKNGEDALIMKMDF